MMLSSAYETLTREGLLSPEELSALNRVDPLAETMFLMMAADGTLAEQELDAVRGAVRGLTDNTLRSGTIKVMLESYQQRLTAEGREERLREIAEEISEDVNEAEGAFALAAAVALADDSVTDGGERLHQPARRVVRHQRATSGRDSGSARGGSGGRGVRGLGGERG